MIRLSIRSASQLGSIVRLARRTESQLLSKCSSPLQFYLSMARSKIMLTFSFDLPCVERLRLVLFQPSAAKEAMLQVARVQTTSTINGSVWACYVLLLEKERVHKVATDPIQLRKIAVLLHVVCCFCFTSFCFLVLSSKCSELQGEVSVTFFGTALRRLSRYDGLQHCLASADRRAICDSLTRFVWSFPNRRRLYYDDQGFDNDGDGRLYRDDGESGSDLNDIPFAEDDEEEGADEEDHTNEV